MNVEGEDVWSERRQEGDKKQKSASEHTHTTHSHRKKGNQRAKRKDVVIGQFCVFLELLKLWRQHPRDLVVGLAMVLVWVMTMDVCRRLCGWLCRFL